MAGISNCELFHSTTDQHLVGWNFLPTKRWSLVEALQLATRKKRERGSLQFLLSYLFFHFVEKTLKK
jgi:hypothetical protein